MKNLIYTQTLLRLPQVLSRFPISRSGWYAGVKAGKYPAPIKLGARTSAWRESDIDRLIETVAR
jgi:prophage regulatory protein